MAAISSGVDRLVTANFQFRLGEPEKAPFADDFKKVLEYLEQLQAKGVFFHDSRVETEISLCQNCRQCT